MEQVSTQNTSAGYRAFKRCADRLVVRGLKDLEDSDVDQMINALGREAPRGAREALDRLRETLATATGQQRVREFTRALGNVRQAYLRECRVEKVDMSRVSRTPVSEHVLVELTEEERERELSPEILASSRVHRFKGLTLLLKSSIFSSMSRETLISLLSNSSLAPAVLSLLRKLKPTKRLVIAEDLLGRTNLYLRRAGLTMVKDLPMDQKGGLIVQALGDPDLRSRAGWALLGDPTGAYPQMAAALMNSSCRHRAEILRVLRRFRFSKAQDTVATLIDDEDPRVAFWARLTLHASGKSQTNHLREWAASVDQPLERVFAKLELINDGVMKEKQLVSELKNADQLAHKYAAEAITELTDFPKQLSKIIAAVQRSSDREERLQAMQKLALFDDRRLLEYFEEGARDAHEPVRRRAISRLVSLKGFTAIEEYFDVDPVLNTPYSELSLSEQQYIIYHVLPLIPRAPDFRFAPYLAALTADTCEHGIDLQFELNLKPILVEFGEPLLYELGRLAFSRNPYLSSIAEELLLRMRLPTAREMVEKSRSSAAPVQVAFRNLYNKSLREQARRELAAAGRLAIQMLLPGLTDPRIQDDVLWILGRIREPSTIPKLIELLGEKTEGFSNSTGGPGFLESALTQCLLSFGEPCFESLRAAIQSNDWSVRCHAAHVLGKARDHQASFSLRDLLDDPNEEVVIATTGALGNLLDEDVIPELAALLTHSSARIIRGVVQALTQINSKDAVPFLQTAVKNTRSLELRRDFQAAIQSLEQSGAEATRTKTGFLTDGIKSLFGTREKQ